jgi:protein associated with RNAse G/E
MDKQILNVGDKLELHCYKHDGKINTVSSKMTVLDIGDDFLVCGDYKTTITEKDGSKHKTKEPAIIFFYKDSWFNILAQLKKNGLFYYCNIATPYVIDEGALKYIDYDLDLRVYPSGKYKILDKNEYKYHKKIMHYSEDIDMIVNKEMEKLIQMKENNEGPFDKSVVEKYRIIYEDIVRK